MPKDDRTAPPLALLLADDTYTFAEMSAWLREAGFSNPRRLEVPGPFPLVLADKPEA